MMLRILTVIMLGIWVTGPILSGYLIRRRFSRDAAILAAKLDRIAQAIENLRTS